MVSKYHRKSNRGSWSEENMEKAIAAIKKKEMGSFKASKTFNVPQSTLRRRLDNTNKISIGTKKHLGRYQTTFNADVEKEILNHILDVESRFFKMTSKEVRVLAYQVANKAGIPNQFNKTKKMAGKAWLRSFQARNPTLSLRKADKQEIGRDSSSEGELSDGNDSEEYCPCMYCYELFSLTKAGESWLKCQRCSKWSHAECAGLSEKAKMFVCKLCS